jgi:moderate conductance mechanosensitive channel
MSSTLTSWFSLTIPQGLRLLVILILAVLICRFLRKLTNGFAKPASSPGRAAQAHEQQTRALADSLYRMGSIVVWVVAIFMALPEFGIVVWPAAMVVGAGVLAVAVGAQNSVRDVIAGMHIVLEEQFAVGDTIQVGETTGRVESLRLRRTVVRDNRGGLVTLSNGEVRTVANLSRDWSQAFVDVTVAVEEPMDRAAAALEAAASGMRGDPAWAQALVDGPRVLGIHEYGAAGATLRVQVRTAPMRQDEVCRELRRRIQLEFQRHAIALPGMQGIDQSAAFHALDDIEKPESAS